MRALTSLVIAVILLLFALSSGAMAQDTDWSQPESIDPLAEGIGDFLDVDTTEYEKTAREAYDSGEYRKAAQYYLALARCNMRDGGSIYNLACCYGLMGEAELAAKFVERSVKAGFEDIGHIGRDPDFESVRETDIFRETLERLQAEKKAEDSKKGKLALLEGSVYQKCYIQLPDDYDPVKSYTLLVGLHGYGGRPGNFIKLWDRFAEHDFVFASLQAPYSFSAGSDTGYSWITGLPDDEEFWKQVSTASQDYVAGAIGQLCREYNIGSVYLLGFSQGCTLAYLTGIHHHDIIDGIICFAGWLETDLLTDDDLDAASRLRVFIAHGIHDRMVQLEASYKARDTLLEHDYTVTLCEFDGAHHVPEEPLQAAEAWMKE